jgi:nicotinate phosphoribosyltransferase
LARYGIGWLDEDQLASILGTDAPIDGFGIGTSLTTSSDVPALDCAYKLQEYAGLARRKRSAGKATWPGRKQVWRSFGGDGRMTGDVLALQGDRPAGEPLLTPVMRSGRRLAPPPTLADIRQKAAHGLAQLPEALRRLSDGATLPVTITPGLIALAEQVDRRCLPGL